MSIPSVRGTRDFYPDDLARRQWLFAKWRAASRRAGFVEVDGPELEHLELYTEKSGEEITEQLYWLTDKGGRQLALRPEFTPTLARMVAARQAALPMPVRWYNISRCFRYERAQKGRLREFFQWNVDLVGVEGEIGDAECIAVAIEGLREVGLRPEDVEVRLSDRRLLAALVKHLGIAEEALPNVFAALDKREKLPPDALAEMLVEAGLNEAQRVGLDRILSTHDLGDIDPAEKASPEVAEAVARLELLFSLLDAAGVGSWCRFDIGIVRGLAYYTGPVWEVHDKQGELRAVFGGGRYDRLLGEMGGQSLPAVGFGCGDVVLGLLLEDRGLVPKPQGAAEYYVAVVADDRWTDVLRVVRHLRARGNRTQFDLKGGGLKRQLKRAGDSGARWCVIVGDELDAGNVAVRDMANSDQTVIPLDALGG